MDTPVLVIHGVANQDETEFKNRVATLQAALNGPWRLIPVFWNPLGAVADQASIDAAIPKPGALPPGPLRTLEQDADFVIGALAGLRGPGGADQEVRDATSGVEVVIAAARAQPGLPGMAEVRDAGDDAVAAQIRDTWTELTWLPNVTDTELLELVGQMVAATPTDLGGSLEVRDVFGDAGAAISGVLHRADDLVGRLAGRIGERVHFWLRTELTPGISKGLGDVFVYQRHRARIQAFVREVLHDQAPGYGTAAKPIAVIGHSLGGIIAFDSATTDADPIYIDRLITFGSQSALLHVIDPRGGAIVPFSPGQRVKLPSTIGRWTNLWEPWDPLAYAAAGVFSPSDGGAVTDLEVQHLGLGPLWTHSLYWTLPAAVDDMRAALKGPS